MVYVERITALTANGLPECRMGVVGHEYPLGENTRRVYFAGGDALLTGEGSAEGTLRFKTDWFNIGGQVGYVIKRFPKRTNAVQYEDKEKGEGRVPKLQEWYSLIGDEEALAQEDTVRYACLVTYLNQGARKTARLAKTSSFNVENGAATIYSGTHKLRVDFEGLTAELESR